MLMALFVVCLLSMPITAFLVGANLIGWVFVTFYCIFGVYEVVFKQVYGVTVSQDVWKLSKLRKIFLTISMVIGWTALIIHLWGIL
jgi:hypothetical protein